MKPKRLKIGSVAIGGAKPAFILGPCVIESEKFVWRMARRIAEICKAESVPFIFKASYDKANRTSVRSYRGIGVPVTTDVHSPAEAEIAGHVIDVLQIPAFLCRQTDLLEAAAATGRVINVKKGQFLAPWDVKNIAEKLTALDELKARGHNCVFIGTRTGFEAKLVPPAGFPSVASALTTRAPSAPAAGV